MRRISFFFFLVFFFSSLRVRRKRSLAANSAAACVRQSNSESSGSFFFFSLCVFFFYQNIKLLKITARALSRALPPSRSCPPPSTGLFDFCFASVRENETTGDSRLPRAQTPRVRADDESRAKRENLSIERLDEGDTARDGFGARYRVIPKRYPWTTSAGSKHGFQLES